MPIKLVCFDLDGTINDGWFLIPLLKNKLLSLKNSGIKTAIITGREAMGTLYYVCKNGFPFDFIGCGGGPVIEKPLEKEYIFDLFDDVATYGITSPGPKKHERLDYVAKVVGVSPNEVLFVDDNDNGSLNEDEMKKRPGYLLGCPWTRNIRWKTYVSSVGGVVSDMPCGLGTLEILTKVFG